jgi:hypothetical protein
MQQTWNLAQLFSFVRETDGQMSAEEICISFADLFDEKTMLLMTRLYRDYWRFVKASRLALQNFIPDAVGGFRVVLPDGHNLLAYEYKHAAFLAWSQKGNACDWLPENPEVTHRWDTAASVPTLSTFFMHSAADHIVADVETFLSDFPSAQITCDGFYVPLLIPTAVFENYRLAFESLPFGDVFQRDFVVDGREKTI